MEKIITPHGIINRLNKLVKEMKTEGVEPTIETINARTLQNIKKKIEEANNE